VKSRQFTFSAEHVFYIKTQSTITVIAFVVKAAESNTRDRRKMCIACNTFYWPTYNNTYRNELHPHCPLVPGFCIQIRTIITKQCHQSIRIIPALLHAAVLSTNTHGRQIGRIVCTGVTTNIGRVFVAHLNVRFDAVILSKSFCHCP